MREAAYVKTSKDVGKWQPLVLQNRRAEQLVFPLKEEIAAVAPLERVVSAWKVGALTPLECLSPPHFLALEAWVEPAAARALHGAGCSLTGLSHLWRWRRELVCQIAPTYKSWLCFWL